MPTIQDETRRRPHLQVITTRRHFPIIACMKLINQRVYRNPTSDTEVKEVDGQGFALATRTADEDNNAK